jgi:hypothetical protein
MNDDGSNALAGVVFVVVLAEVAEVWLELLTEAIELDIKISLIVVMKLNLVIHQ